MPRKPTSQHDFSKRALNPVLDTVRREDRLGHGTIRVPYLTYKLPRLDSKDSLRAARIASENLGKLRYVSGIVEVLNLLQDRPVIVNLNWYEDFNRPKKHPFRKARREYFFIGEGDLGQVLGSWHLVACGYFHNRARQEWIRLQNCWGHDYPLVWMPVATLSTLWDNQEAEAAVTV